MRGWESQSSNFSYVLTSLLQRYAGFANDVHRHFENWILGMQSSAFRKTRIKLSLRTLWSVAALSVWLYDHARPGQNRLIHTVSSTERLFRYSAFSHQSVARYLAWIIYSMIVCDILILARRLILVEQGPHRQEAATLSLSGRSIVDP